MHYAWQNALRVRHGISLTFLLCRAMMYSAILIVIEMYGTTYVLP